MRVRVEAGEGSGCMGWDLASAIGLHCECLFTFFLVVLVLARGRWTGDADT